MNLTGEPQAPKRRIMIVDDHPLTRRGIAELIAQQPDLSVCCEAGTARHALEQTKVNPPDLMLIDISLPDRHGLELIKDLEALHHSLPVLVISMHDESVYAERALRAGARGYLMKNEGGEKLLRAIRQVLRGEVYVSENLSAKIIDAFSGRQCRAADSTIASLTDREFEVFELIGQGMSTREMADQMGLSPKTVETHRLHIREKLGLRSGAELVRRALRWAGAQDLI
jgi:DNA-binding NarL/FixJ family response regulator